MVSLIFMTPSGEKIEVDAEEGRSVLQIAHANGIDLEGACEGSMACSTCHVIVDPTWISKLQPPGDEELDMLDLTYGLTKTSRLGCQIRLNPDLDGLTLHLPRETHNMIG